MSGQDIIYVVEAVSPEGSVRAVHAHLTHEDAARHRASMDVNPLSPWKFRVSTITCYDRLAAMVAKERECRFRSVLSAVP